MALIMSRTGADAIEDIAFVNKVGEIWRPLQVLLSLDKFGQRPPGTTNQAVDNALV